MSALKTIKKGDFQNVKFLIEQNEILYKAKRIDKMKFIKNSLKLASCLENLLNGETSSDKKDLSPAMLDFHIEQMKTYNRN